MKRQVLYTLAALLILSSCRLNAQDQITQKEAAAYFKQQAHRFEIRDCRMYYNESEIVFEGEKDVIDKFGTNYHGDSYWHRYYKDKPIELHLAIRLDGSKQVYINRLNINMGRDKQEKYKSPNDISVLDSIPLLDGFVLFDGVYINAQTRIEDLNQQLKAKGKYTLRSTFGNKASQGYAFEKEYCYPEMDNSVPRLIYITLYYHDDYMSGELFDMQTVRYEYN